ncbi:MAG: DNA polymerase III subunit gamma/tau [Thermomicrobiaceae bacterium]
MVQESTPQTAPAQSQSLYRKYRPNSFDPSQYIGQEHVARTLRNAIVLDRVAHAYLFCGPRGTGKTSTARLLAKAVNCEGEDPEQRPCNQCASCLAINSGSVVDIIEIDAASNRGVDDIRDLREKVRYAPTQLRVKFYIIDEAHQLTKDAFNAFLKTLEEPPDHVMFVLATTEADKLPDTVASRCQRFDFRRFPVESTVQHLQNVSDAENIEAEEEALLLIARHSTGSLRDALGLLDQLALYGDQEAEKRQLTAETVRQVLGLSHNERLVGLVNAIADADAGEGLRLITEATDAGEDIHQLNRQVIGYLRLLLHIRAGGNPPEADSTAKTLAERFSLDQLTALVRTFSEIDAAANKSSYPQLPLEIAVVRAIVGEPVPANVVEMQQPVSARPAASSTAPPPPPPPSYQPEKSAPRDIREGRSARQADPQPAKEAEPPAQPAAQAAPPPQSGSGNAMLEHLVANWSHIRRDVKAENSRIAALLSSADPASVTDDKVILAAPYEFHRNKLNDDNVRQVIERVLSQYTHTSVAVVCMAPDDVPHPTSSRESAGATAAPERSDPPQNGSTESSTIEPEEKAEAEPAPEPVQDDIEGESTDDQPDTAGAEDTGNASASTQDPETDQQSAAIDEQRVQAAKRIFEARETE